jgi:PAS domain S-box-containing protein/putative nucleotidyltransferase with HDIG domain
MPSETDAKTIDRMIAGLEKEDHSGLSSPLQVLTRMLMRLADIPPGEDVYQIIGDALYELVPNSLIPINSFDEETGLFCVRALRGVNGYIERLAGILGTHPVGMSLTINDRAREGLNTGTLQQVPGGLFELTMGNIPKAVCATANKVLDLSAVYAIGFTWKSRLWGSASFLLRGNHQVIDKDLVEKFVKLATVALQRRKVEERLIKTENQNKDLLQRYLNILQASTDMIFTVDLHGNLEYNNYACREHLGYNENELKGISCFHVVHPDDMKRMRQNFASILQGYSTQNHEYRLRKKDDNYITVLISSCPLRDTGGTITGVHAIARDISDRKKMEVELREHGDNLERLVAERTGELKEINMKLQQELHERKRAEKKALQSQRQLENLVETSPAIMCMTDLKTKVCYINRKFQEVTGYSKEDVEGKYWPSLDITPDYTGALLKRMLQKTLGKPPSPMEVKIKCKDGRFKHVSGIGELIRKKGIPVGFQVTAQDITERKEAEERAEMIAKQLLKALEDIVETMAITVELRDPYTAGHQRRVAQLACAIADDIGLSEEQQTGIRFAGLIHDIGKIRIPTEILTHPGVLTEAENRIIRTHPSTGYEILKNIEFPWPIAPAILQHHERIDGSGYPSGLVNDDIIIEAKILAVADVVEAMASHRPYRPSLGLDRALDEIKSNIGTLYDPEAVNSCIKLFRKKRFIFDEVCEINF